jgi:Zn-dependent protease with chaperone function
MITKSKPFLRLKRSVKSDIFIHFLLTLTLLFIFTLNGFAERDYEKEEKIGRRLADNVEKQYELVEDNETIEKVQQIVEYLKEASGIDEINYQIKIVEREGPNAFALPGGFIYLTADLLDYVHSDDELAAVIAHEMGHIIHQHSIKQLQDKQKFKLVELLTLLVTGDSTLGILSELASITVLNSYRREYEDEADLTALELLHKSGSYHPVALLTYFERVNSEYMLKPNINMGIFKTHPEMSARIKKVKEYLDENNIEQNRRLTTNYLVVRGDCLTEEPFFLAQIFINDVPILSFTGIEEEVLDSKMREVVSNFDNSLRLDLQAYEITVHSLDDGRRASLSIGSEEMISLSQEEVQNQGVTPQEALKTARDKIARLLWRLKLELPIFLADE